MKTSTWLIVGALGLTGIIWYNRSQAIMNAGAPAADDILATLLPTIEKLPINDQIAIIHAWQAAQPVGA